MESLTERAMRVAQDEHAREMNELSDREQKRRRELESLLLRKLGDMQIAPNDLPQIEWIKFPGQWPEYPSVEIDSQRFVLFRSVNGKDWEVRWVARCPTCGLTQERIWHPIQSLRDLGETLIRCAERCMQCRKGTA